MSRYQGPFFDVDIHHCLRKPLDILEYLPKEWHDLVKTDRSSPFTMMPPIPDGVVIQHDFKRGDARPEGGGASSAGSDYETMRVQLLDSEPDYRGVLTHQLGDFGGQFNQYLARELSRASNDWTLDAWLAKDERLFATIVVDLSEPEEAAKEIRRVGSHPQMVGVLIAGNTLSRPLGDPLYTPIFEAASELDMPIVVHVSGVGQPNQAVVAAGGRLTFQTFVVGMQQQAHHYISSLIVHGVFERYPNLKVLLSEYGIAWLPYVMTSLDQRYEMLKAESPWVKRLPSEYVRDHIRLSTQPLDESFEDKSAMVNVLSTVEGVDDILCFSSDYPHATMDDPRYVARRMPDEWLDKVLHENGSKLFGLPVHAAEPVPA